MALLISRVLIKFPSSRLKLNGGLLSSATILNRPRSSPLSNLKLSTFPSSISRHNFHISPRIFAGHSQVCKQPFNHISLRSFYLTKPNHVPPIVVAVLRPVGKVLALLVGRRIRSWYRNLPPDKKRAFKEWVNRNQRKIYLLVATFTLFGYIFYVTHLQETPITKRGRFILFTDKQLASIAKFEFEAHLNNYKDTLLPSIHPLCRRVERVAMRILNSNQDIEQIFSKTWTITVVDAPLIKNAFVTQNGQIFVFSGMLNLCTNDDQLGVVLSHEISHAILAHAAEMMSYTTFIDFFVILLIAIIWAILPSDTLAAIVHFLLEKFLSLGMRLPYNRKLETEADEVGLTLAAKACFDVREAVAFWKKMHFYQTMELGLPSEIELAKEIEFISTHPSNTSRADHLEQLLPDAIKIRESCKCPRLPRVDPLAVLENEREAYNRKLQSDRMRNVIYLDIRPPTS